ncbi:MAG: DUF1552 domain-containing protein [Myxococcota bacterium]
MSPRRKARATRRRFMKMAGLGGLSIAALKGAPLLQGMLMNRANAQAGSVKRVVFVFTPGGAPRGLWLPDGRTLNVGTAAYDGLQELCNFREVQVVDGGHGLTRKALGRVAWDSSWRADSIDQQITGVMPATPFGGYVLGVQTFPNNDPVNDYISRRAGSAVPAQDDPAAAYRQLFGAATPPPMGTDTDALLAQQRSILDINRAALNELGARASDFSETFDQHAAALTALQSRIEDAAARPPSEGCSAPTWNSSGHPTTGATDVPFEHTSQLQSDIIVAALACGVSNVMTLQLGWEQCLWYAHDTTYRGDHHGSSHAAPASDNAEMTNYLSRCVAYLLRRLVETDDPAVPGTKLIDNTVVVQVTDQGDGQDHSTDAGPSMVATRMPGFQQGTVASGGSNLMVLEAVVEGLGLSGFKGTEDSHRIWPVADGNIMGNLLT